MQNSLISKFTKMVSATESTIDQTRQPGMKRTCVRRQIASRSRTSLTPLPR